MASANISSDALKLLEGAGAGAQDYVLGQGGFGGKLTSGEATRLLSGFKPTALSGDALVQSATNPTGRPDFSDPFGAKEAISKRLGLTDAQTAETAVANKLREFQTGAQKEQLAIQGNRDLSLGLAQGFQRQSAQVASLGERGILDELNLARNQRLVLEQKAQDEFSVFQSELNTRRDLVAKALQYGDKGVDVNMSVDELTRRTASAQEIYTKKQEKQAEEKAKEQAKETYKQTLKAALLDAGLNTSGNTKKLEKRLAKVNKSALSDAKKKRELELKVLEKELAKPYYAPKDSGLKTTFNEVEQRQMINEAIAGGENWEGIAQTFKALGIDTSEDSVMDTYLKQRFGY